MHVINDKCLGCRFTDCVSVCPIKDCFKIGANMLVIDPNLCIDCGLCVPACPANAIEHDSKSELKWIEHNAKYATIWPAINIQIEPLPNAEELKDVENKTMMFNPESEK